MLTFKDVLGNRTCRMLKATARANRLRFDNKPPKCEQIETLYGQMVAQESLWRAYRDLTAQDIEALQALHASDNHLPLYTFSQAFGEIRPYKPWREDGPRYPWKRPVSVAEKLYYLGFIDLVGHPRDAEVWMPVEVLNYLPPLPQPVPLPHTIHEARNLDMLRIDLAVLLGMLLAQDIRLMWGRWLPPYALKAIDARLYGPGEVGVSELQSGRIRWLHYLADVAGLVEDINGVLKPTVHAWQWLRQTPAEQWQIIRDAWQIDLNSRRPRWLDYRFPSVDSRVWEALLDRLSKLQPGVTYSIESLVASIQPHVPAHELSSIPSLLDGPLQWSGLVAVQDQQVQITLSGKAALNGCYQGMAMDGHARLKVDHHRITVIMPPHPPLFALVQFLSFASQDADGMWIDVGAMRKAAEHGYDAMQVGSILAELVGERLPVTVLETLQIWERSANQLVMQHMVVLSSPDSQLLADIRSDRYLRGMIVEPLSAHHLAIVPHYATQLCQRLKKRNLHIAGQPSLPIDENSSCTLSQNMSNYLYLATKVYYRLQSLVCLPVRIPGAVEHQLAAQLSACEVDQLDQIAARILADVQLALDGYAPLGTPVTQDDPAAIRCAIETAFAQGEPVTIEYFSPMHDKPTRRTIEPLLPISEHNGAEYVEAWCHLAGATRTFRLDRVVKVIE